VFTARYGLDSYITQIRFLFPRLNNLDQLEDVILMGCIWSFFFMLGDGFALKPEHVASNKSDIHLVVFDGL